MTTELEMKKALDGCFFVYNAEKQSVTCRKVPKNYMPSHKPRVLDDDQKHSTAYPWKRSEDDLLIEMRHRNMSWREVAKYMGMSPSAVRNRYLELCLQRKMREFRYRRPEAMCELESRVMALRRDAIPFSRIGEMLGISRNRVAGIVQRVRRRVEQMEMAA